MNEEDIKAKTDLLRTMYNEGKVTDEYGEVWTMTPQMREVFDTVEKTAGHKLTEKEFNIVAESVLKRIDEGYGFPEDDDE